MPAVWTPFTQFPRFSIGYIVYGCKCVGKAVAQAGDLGEQLVITGGTGRTFMAEFTFIYSAQS